MGAANTKTVLDAYDVSGGNTESEVIVLGDDVQGFFASYSWSSLSQTDGTIKAQVSNDDGTTWHDLTTTVNSAGSAVLEDEHTMDSATGTHAVNYTDLIATNLRFVYTEGTAGTGTVTVKVNTKRRV